MDKELNFKIKSVFRPIDRLEEIVLTYGKIPRTSSGYIDYCQCAKLLCEKDGGRLPTMEELRQLASYIYGKEIIREIIGGDGGLTIENIPKELEPLFRDVGWFRLWASSESGDSYASLWNFYSDDTHEGNYGYRSNAAPQALCIEG